MERPTEYWGPRCHASLADKFSDSPDKFENAQPSARDAGLCGDRCSSLSTPTIASLALMALGLCSEVSSCPVGGKW